MAEPRSSNGMQIYTLHIESSLVFKSALQMVITFLQIEATHFWYELLKVLFQSSRISFAWWFLYNYGIISKLLFRTESSERAYYKATPSYQPKQTVL